DRFGLNLATGRECDARVGVAGHAVEAQAAQCLAAAVDVDVPGRGFDRDFRLQPAIQHHVATHAFHADPRRIQGQALVAAHALDPRVLRRAGDDDVAADRVDLQIAGGDAVDVDVRGHRIDVQRCLQRHL